MTCKELVPVALLAIKYPVSEFPLFLPFDEEIDISVVAAGLNGNVETYYARILGFEPLVQLGLDL
jgi:hypothetical protein